MADRIKEAAPRGLFGLGGRKGAAEPAPTPSVAARAGGVRSYIAADAQEVAALEARLLRLNIKAVAGAAGRAPPVPAVAALAAAGLGCRPPHYDDILSPWFAYWAHALHSVVRPHRKLWEFVAIMQSLYEAGVLAPGVRALGLGCAGDPIAAYLASLGIDVLATDLPGAIDRDQLFNPNIVSDAQFDRHVEISYVDATQLSGYGLKDFDLLWSSSVVNQMKTEQDAADVIFTAMETLKPGGVAVHTTEFAFAEDHPTLFTGALTLPRRFFERVADGLQGRGHPVEPVSFALGPHPLDGFVDLPPFSVEGPDSYVDQWRDGLGEPHLKVLSGDVMATSFVIVARAKA